MNRKPKGGVLEMTTPDRPMLLCVTCMPAFGIPILGEISCEMIRVTCLVRPMLSNLHGSLLASALNEEDSVLGIRSLQVR